MILAVNAPFLQGSLQLLAFLCLLAKRNIVHAGVDCCTEGLCTSLRSHGMRVDAGTYAAATLDVKADSFNLDIHTASVTIKAKDLTKHGLIVGVTGAGKTNTCFTILERAVEANIPFMVIESAKSEYTVRQRPA